jgi:YD repeat-containing protein
MITQLTSARRASAQHSEPAGENVPPPLKNITYNARGEVASLLEPYVNGEYPTTLFSYTLDGLPQTVADPLGRVTSFSYDTGGRLLSQTEPDPDGAGALLASTQSFVTIRWATC